MATLSYFHKLQYAGLDLKQFSQVKPMYVYDNDMVHSRGNCGYVRYNYRSRSKLVPQDRAKITASKACAGCFSELFSDVPDFHNYIALARSISDEDARFLRTAFAAKSKKNTPEGMLSQTQTLAEIKDTLFKPGDSEALAAYKEIAGRIDSRLSAIRGAGAPKEVKDKLNSKAISTSLFMGVSSVEHYHPSLQPLFSIMGFDAREAEGVMGHFEKWSNQLAEGADVSTATKALKEGLFGETRFRKLSQLRGLAPLSLDVGIEDLFDYARRVWSAGASTFINSSIDHLQAEYVRLRDDEGTILARFDAKPRGMQPSDLYTSLLEVYAVERNSFYYTAVVPRGLYRAILSISQMDERYKVVIQPGPHIDVTGIPSEVVSTAAVLYDPLTEMAGLREALESAQAI